MLIDKTIYLSKKLKTLSFLFIFLSSSIGFSQKIKVQNKKNKTPIEGVFVYNNNQSVTAISDSSGILDISNFSKRDTLVFTHQGFATFMIPKLNIGNYISLTEQAVTIPTIEIVAEQ